MVLLKATTQSNKSRDPEHALAAPLCSFEAIPGAIEIASDATGKAQDRA